MRCLPDPESQSGQAALHPAPAAVGRNLHPAAIALAKRAGARPSTFGLATHPKQQLAGHLARLEPGIHGVHIVQRIVALDRHYQRAVPPPWPAPVSTPDVPARDRPTTRRIRRRLRLRRDRSAAACRTDPRHVDAVATPGSSRHPGAHRLRLRWPGPHRADRSTGHCGPDAKAGCPPRARRRRCLATRSSAAASGVPSRHAGTWAGCTARRCGRRARKRRWPCAAAT